MSDGVGEMWNRINDIRERVARMEEQAIHEAASRRIEIEKREAMARQVEELLDMVKEARGAKRMAMIFGRWGYGVLGGVASWIYFNWPLLKKLLSS